MSPRIAGCGKAKVAQDQPAEANTTLLLISVTNITEYVPLSDPAANSCVYRPHAPIRSWSRMTFQARSHNHELHASWRRWSGPRIGTFFQVGTEPPCSASPTVGGVTVGVLNVWRVWVWRQRWEIQPWSFPAALCSGDRLPRFNRVVHPCNRRGYFIGRHPLHRGPPARPRPVSRTHSHNSHPAAPPKPTYRFKAFFPPATRFQVAGFC